MKNDNTRELVGLSLYAALIIVTVQFIRIPFGPQFVHLGNALVVIAILIFGARKGALVATVALGLFDIKTVSLQSKDQSDKILGSRLKS